MAGLSSHRRNHLDQEAIRGLSERAGQDDATAQRAAQKRHVARARTCSVQKLAKALRALPVSTNPSRWSHQPPNLLRGFFCRPTEADVQQQLRTEAPIGLQPPWRQGPHSLLRLGSVAQRTLMYNSSSVPKLLLDCRVDGRKYHTAPSPAWPPSHNGSTMRICASSSLQLRCS